MKLVKFYSLLLFICSIQLLRAQTIPGTLASSATVCANSSVGTLSVTGQVGVVVRWEYSLNGSSLWTTIANTATTYAYSNLSQSTWFRVIVQNPGFPALSTNTVLIKTNDPTDGGTAIALNTTECTGNNVKLQLSGYTGSILGWQWSTNGGVNWNPVASSNDSIYKYAGAIGANTLYRALVKSGVCPTLASDSILVTAAPASVGGSVASNATVCAGTNSNSITLSGNTGTVIRWESSPTGNAPWATINNTSGNLAYSNLLSNTYYRSIVRSANCPEAASSVVMVKVDANSIGGFINGTQQVCSTVNNGVLNLNGNNGNILQWETSTNGSSWNTTAVNTGTFGFSNLTQNTWYKVQVVNGTCPPVYSNTLLVTVNPLPAVNYTFTQACQGKAATFSNLTPGSNLYDWDFKDGSTASVANPSHTYANSGSYLVKLTARSTNNCVDSITKTLIVYARPNVNYTAVDSTCGFNQVAFTNNTSIASGSISNYVWNFGDNTPTSSATSPNHTYGTANTYLVKLVATSNNGCLDSVSKPILIFPKPSAGFTTANVCKKSAAAFINTSYINGGGILYAWDFGDTNTSTLTSPSHSYAAAGNYNVRLITASNHGCKDTVILPIRIFEQPDLTTNVLNVCLGKTSAFTQTIAPTVTNYTLSWNMGDGNTLPGNSPSYTYASAGNYQTIATLTTDSGCVSTANKITTIHPLPAVNFNFFNVCSADSAQLNNLSSISSGSVSYAWNFGNNTTSTLSSPKVKYAAAGVYSIQLIVTSNNACQDSVSKSITIFDAPVTSFNFSNACDGNPIQFNNTSTVSSGIISNSLWNFGDNTNSSLVNPSKQYLSFGTYSVNLETTSSNGCKSNLTQVVSVYEGPVANFSFVNQCRNLAIPFTNASLLGSGTFNSAWNFGDTTYSALNSPSHLYQFAGSKEVWLKVTSNNGCVDSISKFVQAYPIPMVNAGRDTTISLGFGVQLQASGASAYAWSPAAGLNNPTVGNPIANPEQSTAYIVEGTTAFGCQNTDTVLVNIDDNFLVIPYNLVTPNGNGKNDVWFIKNIESYPANKVTILDEWGVVIFEKTSYANTWDGRNKRGEMLPDGTYFYVLSFDQSPRIYKGYITLLRNN